MEEQSQFISHSSPDAPLCNHTDTNITKAQITQDFFLSLQINYMLFPGEQEKKCIELLWLYMSLSIPLSFT